jgi:hypothetical protein
MATFTELLPATKSQAHRALKWTPSGCGCGTLELACGRSFARYSVEEIPAADDFDGRGFRLVKGDGEVYDALLSNRSPDWDSCDCAGHTYGGHCKHADALRELLASGQLDAAGEDPREQGDGGDANDAQASDEAWQAECDAKMARMLAEFARQDAEFAARVAVPEEVAETFHERVMREHAERGRQWKAEQAAWTPEQRASCEAAEAEYKGTIPF